MRVVGVSELASGDVLARPVHGKNGIVMLEAGTVLTEQYIHRLKNLKVASVHLLARGPETGAAPDGASRRRSESRDAAWVQPDIDRLKNDDNARREASGLVMNFAETTLMRDRVVLPAPEAKFRQLFRDILMEIVSQRIFAEELGVMMLTDRFLFDHALHVTLCSDIIGAAKSYDASQLYELSVGALFCDIGMTRLPAHLTKANRILTAAEIKIMRQHTTEGYHLLKGMKEVPALSAPCALLHHERYRGEGYPLGIRHDAIPEFAQIVGIADVYNALISPRHYRKPHEPGEATEYLFASGNYEFELSLVKLLLKYLTLYPASSVVRLSNGQVAVIAETEGRPINRPMVQVVCESDGKIANPPYMLDLGTLNNVVIVGRADQ